MVATAHDASRRRLLGRGLLKAGNLAIGAAMAAAGIMAVAAASRVDWKAADETIVLKGSEWTCTLSTDHTRYVPMLVGKVIISMPQSTRRCDKWERSR